MRKVCGSTRSVGTSIPAAVNDEEDADTSQGIYVSLHATLRYTLTSLRRKLLAARHYQRCFFNHAYDVCLGVARNGETNALAFISATSALTFSPSFTVASTMYRWQEAAWCGQTNNACAWPALLPQPSQLSQFGSPSTLQFCATHFLEHFRGCILATTSSLPLF